MKKYKHFYTITLILTLVIMSVGSTYAYLAATVTTGDTDVQTKSKTYSVNLSVYPKYPATNEGLYTLIPMKDELVETAYSDDYKCKDKGGAGACYAYNIRVYEYSQTLEYVSGKINIVTSNVTNLSYMLYDEEGNPLILTNDGENDIYKKKITSGEDTTLGDSGFYIKGTTELNLVLVIWLSDTLEEQNENDIGTFNGSVTFSTGRGGQITGNITSTIIGTYTG